MGTEFDDQLKSRLLAFQADHGLVQNGKAGLETWRALHAGAGGAPAGRSMPHAMPFYINPDVFEFKPSPSEANWRNTGCVSIVFAHGGPYWPTRIEVGVVVWAPIKLKNNKEVPVRRAQLDAANAATVAANVVKEFLDAHLMILSEVQPRFVGYMYGAIVHDNPEIGYRVQGCYPHGKN
jgi:hypothetical protein